jgi:hypothetical protein
MIRRRTQTTCSWRAYDPTSHPDDMLMASWLFWEQCRGYTGNTEWEQFGMYIPQ